ncbi:hypothetical protein Tco_0205847 [Tanacetum coccineum]
MFKLDIECISHRLKNNKDAHEVYLKKTIENTDTLRGLVECARKQNPGEPLLESAYMYRTPSSDINSQNDQDSNATVCNIKTDNGTEFVNQTLRAYYEESLEAAPQSLEQEPPSPDYMPGPEYLKCLSQSDNEILEDLANYPTNGGDDDEEEESSEDDDEEEEASEDKEEEEHLASADSTLLVLDSVPSSEETEPFDNDESATTPPPPRSPQTIVPLSQTKLHWARISVRPHTPPPPFAELHLARCMATPAFPSLPPSPLSPWFEFGESLTAAARQTGHTLARRVNYGFLDTMDASIRASEGRVMTAIEEVNERVVDLATTNRLDAKEFHTRHQDAQDNRALLRA